MYVYFIAIHKRVSIGRTINLFSRIVQYERLGCKAEVLGLIRCDTERNLKRKEKQVLKHFQFCKYEGNHDVFYLCPEMVDWIVDNTIPLTADIWESCNAVNRKRIAGYNKQKKTEKKAESIDNRFASFRKSTKVEIAKREYSTGEYSKSKLARMLGVSVTTINNYLKEV